MDYRNIGPLEVSTVGLGCNNFGRKLNESDSASVVKAALDVGVNFFDTADVYGYGDHSYSGTGRSEEYLGRALGKRREDVVVATKFGISMSKTDASMRGGGRSWVRQACEDSLRRLQTDYIDLYQMHRPDRDSHVSETLAVLDELVSEGKIRVVGCSNFSVAELNEAQAASQALQSVRFKSVQNEFSLLRPEAGDDVLPACESLEMAFLPYFPLASGLLTGKYRKGEPAPAGTRLSFWEPRPHQTMDEDILAHVERLSEFAGSTGHTILELAISWLLARPQVASVIAGATSGDQVQANVAAADWSMSAAELAAVGAQ